MLTRKMVSEYIHENGVEHLGKWGRDYCINICKVDIASGVCDSCHSDVGVACRTCKKDPCNGCLLKEQG